MSTDVFSIPETPNESDGNRVVEHEWKLNPEDWKMPEINAEPVLKVTGQVLLTGLGLGVLAYRGVKRAFKAAYKAGAEAAEKDGSFAQAISDLAKGVRKDKAAEPVVSTHVPVLPINDYDELTVDDLVAKLADLDLDALETVREYELAHARRTTVLEAIVRLSAGM